MLKKLIKFGNSNAIVLDRTIMALINIQEKSTVKLRVEGNKLIITSADEKLDGPEELKLRYENINEMCSVKKTDKGVNSKFLRNSMGQANQGLNSFLKKVEKDPKKKKQLDEFYASPENEVGLEKGFEALHKKYAHVKALFIQRGFIDECVKLQEIYEGKLESKEYLKAMFTLRYKLVPEAKKMDQEMDQLAKKFDPTHKSIIESL